MKYQSKISVCTCPKHICCCKSQNLHFIEDKTEDSYNLFDILAHNNISIPQKQTPIKVSKAPKTTYRQDYYPKCLQTCKKAIPPFPALYASDKKMSHKTIHKTDFKPYSEKSKKDCVGRIVKPENNLVCSLGKFGAKSETKSSYKNPASKKGLTGSKSLFREQKFSNKDNISISVDKCQALSSETTYSSAYKVPKGFQKTEIFVPKSDMHKVDSSKAYKDISQYRSDFKRPKNVKKECIRKIQKYSAPDEPMENKTTYRMDYKPKKPTEKKAWGDFSTYSSCGADVNRLCCPCMHNARICQAAC
ncbi:uncharacterized protein [Parasteatoda tepidariorum]|uniref:uncharacterized protein n=1 Tax=Parasteatoda tepidariorum TaxID=114398 RepID=UPI001C71BB9F|nr:uncharacterized protein LOC107452887 [Parasteatoda tepidariorum]